MSKLFLIYGLLITLGLGLANARGWLLWERTFPRGCASGFGGRGGGGYYGGGGFHK